MVRRTQQHRKHAAVKLGGVGVLAVVLLGGGLTLASANDGAAPQTANCPTVRDKLSNVPAAAVAGVEQELANLDKQIAEANARLAQQAANPQGGPNFIQNAILGPLASKRTAALDRIGITINRVGGQRPDLASLATCGLNAAGVPSAVNGNAGNGNAGNGNAGNGNAGNGNAGNGNTGNGNAGAGVAQRVSCPTVADRLPAVPAQAAAEVQRELANLESQIADANARLGRQAANPQGGPNFVRNAIIGPLEDRRVAAINRIATAIGRVDGNRPADLVNLARPCSAG
ncbi:hypothetical protein KBX50_29630 [Micromonospora sp. C51]|nr:hypothetical protein [Micromonospora sp. C51]